MIHFDNDYTEGAHETILNRLIETNMVQAPGYGLDQFTKNAQKYIKEACMTDEIDVHLLSGGTQTNLTVIAASLRPHQAVITADTGHIHTLETGAIEAVGHKMILLPGEEGKIKADQVQKACEDYWHNNGNGNVHRVQPGMVYLSNPTEVGTLYSKEELAAIRKVCDEYDIKLFIDGARIGYGLVAETNDLTLKDLTELCDVFYIGGTKLGALFGEAVVIRNDELKRDFRAIMKQKGALLAKGRALGIQFEVLFEDNLYFELSKHAVNEAMRIKQTLMDNSIPLKYEAYTNQLFPIFTNEQLETIKKHFNVMPMEAEGENSHVVRMCTSWATKKENVDKFIDAISS